MLDHDHPRLQQLVCQKCKGPLRADDSLVDLNLSNADRLLAKIPRRKNPATPQSQRGMEPVSRRIIPLPSTQPSSSASRLRGSQRDSLAGGPTESFVMLTRSQIASPMVTPSSSAHTATTNNGVVSSGEDAQGRNLLSNRLKVANRLFDIMSSRSDIDHPMCQECADMLTESLTKQLTDVSRERDCYIDFLRKVNSSTVSNEEQENLKREIAEPEGFELRPITEAAIEALRETERQRDVLKEELRMLEEEANELDALEESYWQDFNAFQIKLQTFHNERDSVNLKYDHDAKQLERLQKTNVYKDTFSISHDGHFGTINGFRLGRLPNHPVSYAAGVRGSSCIERDCGGAMGVGSFSRIEKIEGDKASYELYVPCFINNILENIYYHYALTGGEFAVARILSNRRFDLAMVAFLNCLEQFCDYAERQDPNLKFPYKINKDKIGDVTIRLTLNQDEWTKALKFTLTNTKWILIFASSAGMSSAVSSVPPTPTVTVPDGRLDSPRSDRFVGLDRGKRNSIGSVNSGV
ncbi:autophagy protein Apg6-domain-containing protein [Jimgerdemannia flammicorona]|uniref:Autophagy protein Apg6-domain-containing protein n=1 Tax=Jimgerdemannia flammicorona TaxID=994334 RepID=A0A433QJM0_9FUNG|nr:autophagy protein Apg6-domain-containing protein [Jimgerdemannia flammicorona]